MKQKEVLLAQKILRPSQLAQKLRDSQSRDLEHFAPLNTSEMEHVNKTVHKLLWWGTDKQ